MLTELHTQSLTEITTFHFVLEQVRFFFCICTVNSLILKYSTYYLEILHAGNQEMKFDKELMKQK